MNPVLRIPRTTNRTSVSTRVPPVASWILTDSCNLACTHCYVGAGPSEGSRDLSGPQRARAVDRLAEAGVHTVFLSGGEVTLLPFLNDLVARLNARGIAVWICTNGWLVTGRMAQDLKRAGVVGASVSVDHARAAEHDRIRRRKGAWDRALRAIDQLRKAGIQVHVDYTATALNRADPADLVKVLKDAGVQLLSVKRFRPIKRGLENKSKLLLDIAEYRKLIDEFLVAGASHGLPLGFFDPAAEQFACEAHAAAGYSYGTGDVLGCMAGLRWFGITPDGTVTPCPLLNLPIGHVVRDDLRHVFAASSVVATIVNRSRRRGRCGTCSRLRECGGCRAHALAETGDYLAEDPYCVYGLCR